jgi:hypothetical protein
MIIMNGLTRFTTMITVDLMVQAYWTQMRILWYTSEKILKRKYNRKNRKKSNLEIQNKINKESNQQKHRNSS